jgi:hypothetical protein
MKVAKIVTISLMTRVVVDEDASENDIFEAARHRFKDKIDTEMGENIGDIYDDVECPYDPDLDFEPSDNKNHYDENL